MRTTKITPQFSDSDALGHINHLAVARWFEVARSSLYRHLFPNFLDVTDFLVMVHMDVDYVSETSLDGEVTIKTEIAKIGNTSFTVSQEAWQNDRLCSRGNFAIVYFDLENRKPQKIDDDLKRKIERWANDEKTAP